jgi:hypothetical protein
MDKYLKILAVFEQAGAFMQVVAIFLATYHKGLIENGFERDEALKLVIALQREMIREGVRMSDDADQEEGSEE